MLGLEDGFNRNYTGVGFSPYVKNWILENDKPTVAKWHTYTLDEIKVLLSVVSKKFSHISTYGIGATGTF